MEYLKICRPGVVDESVDGEVVIVNLDKGLYFSTDGTGAAIWSRIDAGHSIDEIGAWANGVSGETQNGDVEAFVDSLLTHDLVERVAEPAGSSEPMADPEQWSTPELQVFSDMEDLLLLDPIHDVEETAGWPNAAPGA